MPSFKNNIFENHDGFAFRVVVAGIVLSLLAALLLFRVAKLQVYDYQVYQTRANNNHIQILPTAPRRGQIYDKDGELIAGQTSDFDLLYYPQESKISEEQVIELLKKTIDLTEKEEKIIEQSSSIERSRGLLIRQKVNYEEVAKISALNFLQSGVVLNTIHYRYYPKKSSLATITGYVGKISDKEKQKIAKDGKEAKYKAVDLIGKVGLERYYDDDLRGASGVKKVETTAGGHIVRVISEVAPTAGSDLITAIDSNLQKKVYELMGDRNGAVIILDVRNGDVLALASNTTYDPNLFIGKGGSELANLFIDTTRPLLNRAISGSYPPASTFKPFVGLAGLHHDKRELDELIYCPGYFTLPGTKHRYRDWKKSGHGKVDFHKSLVSSVDTYYYGLAVSVGIGLLNPYISEFNFGKTTGIDLIGEKSALLPSAKWKKKRVGRDWNAGDTVSFGIGQGYMLATPLQIAVAYSAIANKGVAYRPRIVKEIRDSVSEKITIIPPQKIIDVNIEDENINAVIAALTDVNVSGTAGRRFKNAAYTSAGKTGTAQVISIAQDKSYNAKNLKTKHKDHALYVGFAPVENPQIVVSVILENAGGGSSNAAPLVRKLMDEYFKTSK